jgi:hypothetical protein
MSWPRIKQGYEALAQLYGTSRLKRNRYASMAFAANDFGTAQKMFKEIGNDWEPAVWWTKAIFDKTRALAAKGARLPMKESTSLTENSPR